MEFSWWSARVRPASDLRRRTSSSSSSSTHGDHFYPLLPSPSAYHCRPNIQCSMFVSLTKLQPLS